MRSPIWWFLGFILLVVVVVSITFSVLLGLALLAGWILTRFLDFSLADASILGGFILFLTALLWLRIFQSFGNTIFSDDDMVEEDDEDEEDRTYATIAANRFYKNEDGKSWAAWLNYEIANDIYIDFQDSPKIVSGMGERQVQELAVRLAEIGTGILQAKTARARNLKITKNVYKRQMTKMGQRAYDDDILDVALEVTNTNIDYYYTELLEVIKNKDWDGLTDKFDS